LYSVDGRLRMLSAAQQLDEFGMSVVFSNSSSLR